MRAVKQLDYNWRQVGSTQDRDGSGEDYERITVGVKGVVSILENEPRNSYDVWSYLVISEGNKQVRIFNPNYVEYLSN